VIFPYIHILYLSLTYPSVMLLYPLLQMTLTGFNVQYSYVCRKYLNHIHPLLPSSFIFPLPLIPSLNKAGQNLLYIPVFHCLSAHCSMVFCLCILPVNIFTLICPTFSNCSSLYFSPSHILDQFSVHFIVSYSSTDVIH
jgi:hypothetical protein